MVAFYLEMQGKVNFKIQKGMEKGVEEDFYVSHTVVLKRVT